MVASGPHTYRYRIDKKDIIVWVDSWWLAFAQENGAANLTCESVIGHSLWEFVSGVETQHVFQAIHERVRSSRKAAIIPFRCDSPLLKRFMRLTLSSEPAGQLLYETVLVRAEPRRRLSMLDPQQPRSNALLTLCSCCTQALVEPVGWLDIDEAVAMLSFFEQERVPQLRYTICSQCAHRMSHTPGNGDAA